MYYYSGTDITHTDLEKNRLKGDALSNGRSLQLLATNGAKDYRKAYAYACDKWDMKKNKPKESGMTVDNVIEYVRRRMYLKNIIKLDSDNKEDKVKVIALLDDSKDNNKEEEDSSNDEVETRTSITTRRSNKVDITRDVARGSLKKSDNDYNATSKDGEKGSSTSVDDTDMDDKDDEDNDNDEDEYIEPSGNVDYDEDDEDDDDDNVDDDDDSVIDDDDVGDDDEFYQMITSFPPIFASCCGVPSSKKRNN